MKRSLKIFLSCVMLALMVYNMVGYIFVFELAEYSNREDMQRLVSDAGDSDLQLLKVSDITRVIRKGSHEIIFEDKRYDVKKEFTKNGCTYFYCMHDKAEENLYAGLSANLSSDSDIQSGAQHVHTFSIVKNFVKDFFFQPAVENMAATGIVRNAFNKDDSFSSTVFSSVITPPPQYIVA